MHQCGGGGAQVLVPCVVGKFCMCHMYLEVPCAELTCLLIIVGPRALKSHCRRQAYLEAAKLAMSSLITSLSTLAEQLTCNKVGMMRLLSILGGGNGLSVRSAPANTGAIQQRLKPSFFLGG